jgi:hypothetical protein
MVVHWWRRRGPHWRKGLLINAVGAGFSAIVFLIASVTKFSEGAWVALLVIALLATVAWRIRRNYDAVRRALALHPVDLGTPLRAIVPEPVGASALGDEARQAGTAVEEEESPDQLRHLTVVPVARLDLVSLRALAYAVSLGQPVLAVHLSPGQDEAERFRGYWTAWVTICRLRSSNLPTVRSSRRSRATSTRCTPNGRRSRSRWFCPS